MASAKAGQPLVKPFFCLPKCDRQLHTAQDILAIENITSKYLLVGTFGEEVRL